MAGRALHRGLMLPSTSSACYSCVIAQTSHSTGSSLLSGAGFSTSPRLSRRDSFRWTGPRDDEQRELRKLKRELGRFDHLDKNRLRPSSPLPLNSSTDFTGSRATADSGSRDRHPPGYREEPPEKPHWRLHREALKEKFPEGWNPPRKVSRGEMNTIRRLHDLEPEQFSTPALADQFKVSAEAIRRILRSNFRTDEEVEEERVGDSLLREAELGEYENPSSYARRSSLSRFAAPGQDDELDPPERTAPAAVPLQEGFDAATSPLRTKWVSRKRHETSITHSPMTQETPRESS